MNSERKTNRASSRQSVNRLSNSSQLRDKTLTNKENFATDFIQFCADYKVFPLPLIQIIKGTESFRINLSKIDADNNKISSQNQFIDNKEYEEPDEVSKESGTIKKKFQSKVTVFSLIYDHIIELDVPKDLRSKGNEVNESMLNSLRNCMKKYTTITTLKLQKCSINSNEIEKIYEILSDPGCSIKDLNLDVNPNIEQNYHLLCAPGTNLLYLSLKLCEINDDGVAKIASNLTYRDEPNMVKLIVLNLANNNIYESGANKIGDMLRTNRSLQSLTLTGNRINDAGAESILEPLKTFTLRQNEAIEKRRRIINRLKLCDEKVANLSGESLRMEFVESDTKERGQESRTYSKKRRASSRQVISNSSESSANQSTPVKVQSLRERAEAIIPVDNHPLVKDVVSSEGNLLCSGNLELQHLNLSFNKITEETLQHLIECIQKQRLILMIDDIGRGLRHLNIEGNDFDTYCDLAVQLNETMNQRRSSK